MNSCNNEELKSTLPADKAVQEVAALALHTYMLNNDHCSAACTCKKLTESRLAVKLDTDCEFMVLWPEDTSYQAAMREDCPRFHIAAG